MSDREKIDEDFWTAHRELGRTIKALNQAINPKTTVLANIMFEAQRQKETPFLRGGGVGEAYPRSDYKYLPIPEISSLTDDVNLGK